MREVLVCPICGANTFKPFLYCEDYTVSHETFRLIECTQCRFLITSPSPDITSLGKYYLSTAYISHSRKAVTLLDRIYVLARTFTLRWKLKLISHDLHHSNDLTLLDYGCGTGEFLKKCQSRGWSAYGVEPSEKARKESIENSQSRIASTLDDISFSDFNVITLWHVLEHIPDLNETIEKLKAKLKESGTMFIALPNHRSWDAKFYSSYWAGYDVPRHLWHFSQSNMEKLLQKNSLKLIHIIPMKLDAFYVSLLSEKYKSNAKSTLKKSLNALLNGLRSNFHARNKNEYSSLIYVVRK